MDRRLGRRADAAVQAAMTRDAGPGPLWAEHGWGLGAGTVAVVLGLVGLLSAVGHLLG